MIGDERFTARKERRKIVRVIFQTLFLLVLAAITITALFTLKEYRPYTERDTAFSGDKGFIALSYFGVDRIGDQTLIGVDRLAAHLEALKNLGYVTITQQDIVDYYETGKELPAKSLFLMFEDGRRDTSIFTEKTLEMLNFKATALTYTEKFGGKDTKFLLSDDLKQLEKTTFWEFGSNGHRLAFINVFDRYEQYLGELTPLKYSMLTSYLGRDYNHYLMDYIRDENRIPKESYLQMKARVSYDYERLEELYTDTVGSVPAMHVLMHSNTGSFGNDVQVSAVNEYWIKKLFKMNFNREGYSLNQRNSSIYDLTRMQPQAYWTTNHLLMRIKYDTEQELDFVRGDLSRDKLWETLEGAAEFQREAIFLTSLPEKRGLMRLKNSGDFKNVKLSVKLRGNQLGQQKIYLRAQDGLSHYLSVAIINNTLCIAEKSSAAEKELLRLNLAEFDGRPVVSVPEDKKAAQVRALETFGRYADTGEIAKGYLGALRNKEQEKVAAVEEGAPEYVPVISPNAKGERRLSINLKEDVLSVYIDEKEAVVNLPVGVQDRGAVYLEAAWSGYGWSQRNLADDVYDGVFEHLFITENTGQEKEEVVLFDDRYQGMERVWYKIWAIWEAVINWFVMYL